MKAKTALTVQEVDALQAHEETIEKHKGAFLEVGAALLAIRDERLYCETHTTFALYVTERWGFERAHANRLCAAAQVNKNLSPMGDTCPPNERQSRPLAKVAPSVQRKIWGEVSSGPRPVTAAAVEQKVAEHLSADDGKPEPELEPEVAPEGPDGPVDADGFHLPDAALPGWHLASEMVQFRKDLRRWKKRLREIKREPGSAWIYADALVVALDKADKLGLPAVHRCKHCEGAGCELCLNQGVVPKTMLDDDDECSEAERVRLARQGLPVTLPRGEYLRAMSACAVAQNWGRRKRRKPVADPPPEDDDF